MMVDKNQFFLFIYHLTQASKNLNILDVNHHSTGIIAFNNKGLNDY